MTWKMTKSLKNVKNEKCTLKDLEYGEKTENHGKWEIHTLGREIWRGKLKKVENLEMSTVGRGIWQENWKSWKMRNIHLTTWKMTKSLKNVKNEKCSLKDLEYGEKTENLGNWEIHTLGGEIRRGKLKKLDNLEMSTVAHEIWQETENHGNWKTSTWRLEKWRNPWKTWKMRNAHCRTWNMARKLKITENEKYTL